MASQVKGRDDLSGLMGNGLPRVDRRGADAWVQAPNRSAQDVLSILDRRFRQSGPTILFTLGREGFRRIVFLTREGVIVVATR